jgi:pilus assembly protein FimV
LRDVQISLQRRANGTAFLRLTSPRPVNEPFVDLILEASWASGRIVRDYTMLFDPPNMRAQAAPSVTAPATTAAPSAPSAPVVTPRTVTVPPASAPAPRVAKTPAAPKPAPATPSDGVRVKSGDTAAGLAARYKPEGVSLDQMLVAMLRSSPDAFIGGNVNRLKSGAVIDMQGAAASAPSTEAAQARQTIVAQSKDFNEFRRRLASGAPVAAATAPGRASGGKVEANVSDSKTQASAPDKLTLSKGSVAAKAKEEQIAKDKQAKADAARVAELSKNIQDLNKLGTSTTAKPSAAPAPAGTAAPAAPATSAPGVKVTGTAPAVTATTSVVTSTAAKPVTPTTAPATAPTVAATATPTATTTASVPSVAPATSTAAASTSTSTVSTATTTATAASTDSAPAPVAAAPKPKAPPPPPPPPPSFFESLTDNPLVLPGAGALLAGLGGLAFWRMRQRKKATQVDSSFLESRLQPDSFFGASGGQRVDTADSQSNAPGSSMVYSPSQLDAAGDVDPVAEADVYLAYGRDLQAEEILKEAMRINPSRVAIHAKLMEIYAKRRDAKAFEAVAKEAHNLTGGEGPEWETASGLGRELDPANPLYQAGNSRPVAGVSTGVAAAALGAAAFDSVATAPQQKGIPDNADVDFDLDLDFSTGGDDLVAAPGSDTETTGSLSAVPAAPAPVDFNFGADAAATYPLAKPSSAAAEPVKLSVPDMASFSSGLSFSPEPISAPTPMASSAPTAPMSLKTEPSGPASLESLEFDLGNLSLDLPGSNAAAAASSAVDAGISGDPLETKLALALEFKDIGDLDGARALVQEVADEATGALKARANKMLADLG